jgi:glyoxylase-like metal-dependent hydrolase (beta-lactamase superfamily II)
MGPGMAASSSDPPLLFPLPVPPEPGQLLEVAPGVLWARLALPFRLDHVNVYLIEDGPGWALIDTGLGDQCTRETWDALLAGPLAGRPLTRLIVTHFHPDHAGAAGWLATRLGLPVAMSQTEYLVSVNLHLDPGALDAAHYRAFYSSHGLDQDTTDRVVTQGHNYLRMVTGLPPTFRRLIAGETVPVGGRPFEVLTGGGHAPEQVMLYCRDENLFLAADQVLAKISPNVSVWAVDPDGDPLGIYLRSLDALIGALPEDVLVLPGHNLPFRGLHARAEALKQHHEVRCRDIEEACRRKPLSAAELVPVIFRKPLDPHQLGFAFSEVLAHVNFMLRQGRLRWASCDDGIVRVAAIVGAHPGLCAAEWS